MMQKISTIFLALACTLSVAWAQNPKSKITTGVIAHDNRDYVEAVQSIEPVLSSSDTSMLKSKDMAKAYLHLGRSYYQIGTSEDAEMAAQYPNALLKAHGYLSRVRQYDERNRYEKDLTLMEPALQNALFNAGATAYNDKDYDAAKAYFERAFAMDDEQYRTAIMLGYSNLMVRDTPATVSTLRRGLNLYEIAAANLENPDDIASSAYQQLAILYLEADSAQQALATIGEGVRQFPMDDGMRRIELSIYSTNPELIEQAKEKFEAALQENPDDVEIKAAYAGILTQSGEDERGLELYREVIAADTNNYAANVNVGVYYINRAAAMSEQMMSDETSNEEAREMETEIITMMRDAYPYMLRAHRLRPEVLEWVRQLAKISTLVPELLPQAKKWGDLQRQMLSNRPDGN